jgi:hypothetical protein
MTAPASPVAGPAGLDAAEVDAVAAVVRGCPGVSALDGGRFGEVASYLPGRVVSGVAVDDDRIRVQVRSAWGIPATDLAAVITAALTPLAGGRPVDVTISDIDDPSPAQPAGPALRAVPPPPSSIPRTAGRSTVRSSPWR